MTLIYHKIKNYELSLYGYFEIILIYATHVDLLQLILKVVVQKSRASIELFNHVIDRMDYDSTMKSSYKV